MNPRDCPYMDYIKKGLKHAEGRINSHGFQRLKVGDTIYFHNRRVGIICEIIFLHKYKTFRAMLEEEGADKMLPQLLKLGLSKEEKIQEGIKIYEKFPNSYKVNQFGCLAIGVTYLEDHNPNHY